MGRVTERESDLLEVVRRERLLLQPNVRAHADRVHELVHPDLLEFGASGRVWDRASVVEALGADPEVPGEISDFSPVKLDEDVVLLTYRVLGGAGSLRSSVWVRDARSGWLLRFHQGTRLLPEV